MKRIFSGLLALTLLLTLALTGCGQGAGGQQQNPTGPDWSTLEQTGSMQLDYARQFSVDYYGDYALISIPDDQARYLLVPEGEGIPKGLEEDITVLCQPLNNIYLVASASMDMFLAGTCPGSRRRCRREIWCMRASTPPRIMSASAPRTAAWPLRTP